MCFVEAAVALQALVIEWTGPLVVVVVGLLARNVSIEAIALVAWTSLEELIALVSLIVAPAAWIVLTELQVAVAVDRESNSPGDSQRPLPKRQSERQYSAPRQRIDA